MKSVFIAFALFGWICSHAVPEEKADPWLTLFVCGDDKVIQLQTDTTFTQVDTVWTWRASETVDLPPAYLPLLKTMDECKPIGRGDTLLLTSSSGAALVLERHTKRALFYAKAPNAHSIEILPGGRIAVALSTNPKGNSLELYDSQKPEKIIYRDSLYSGHGVVWLPETQRLYALGFDELRAYRLADWETDAPRLLLDTLWKLPDSGGHELSRISGSKLLVSTHESVWTFHVDPGGFHEFEPLAGVPNVKSAQYDEDTGLLVYTKAEISWWTHHVYLDGPTGVIAVPQLKMYKVRVAK